MTTVVPLKNWKAKVKIDFLWQGGQQTEGAQQHCGKMQIRENVNPDINEKLAKMIIQLMFKKDKSNEEKLKEKLRHVIRPASSNYDLLVTIKVDELI